MQIQIIPAQIKDIEKLIDLMKAYYEFDRLHFNQRIALTALNHLIENENLGRLWIISFNAENVDYIAITFGFSLEFGGKDAFIDEFFILEDFRGKGIGRKVLGLVKTILKDLNASALYLEVDRENVTAQKYFHALGFKSRELFINISQLLI